MNVTAVTSLSVNGLINIEEKDSRERFPACVSLKSSSYTRRSIMCSSCGTILSARWCSTYHRGWIHTAPAKCPGRPPLVTKWTPPVPSTVTISAGARASFSSLRCQFICGRSKRRDSPRSGFTVTPASSLCHLVLSLRLSWWNSECRDIASRLATWTAKF